MASARIFLEGCPRGGESLPQAPGQGAQTGGAPCNGLAFLEPGNPAAFSGRSRSGKRPCTLLRTKGQSPAGHQTRHIEGAQPPGTQQHTQLLRLGWQGAQGGSTQGRLRTRLHRQQHRPGAWSWSRRPIGVVGAWSRGHRGGQALPSSALELRPAL